MGLAACRVPHQGRRKSAFETLFSLVCWLILALQHVTQQQDDFPRIRIIGICFGLQVIARAFGRANIVKSSAGWEVGSTRIDLTDAGRQLIWGDAESLKTGNVDGLKDHVVSATREMAA